MDEEEKREPLEQTEQINSEEQVETVKYNRHAEEPNKKKMPTVVKVLIVLVLLVIIGIAGTYFWYSMSIDAVDKNMSEVKTVEINQGEGTAQIAKTLKENDLINNDLSFRIYCKINKVNSLQAGTYEFSPNMNIEQIVNKLQKGEVVNKDISIMFKEGKNMRAVAQTIADKTKHTYEDVISVFESKEYAKKLIPEYWFLTDEILDSDVYYPLEGYLFPETYTFESAEVSIDDIITKMLKQTDKILSKYKEQISQKGYSVHKFLSLASVVECEGTNYESRQGIAGVFTNRIRIGMALQSDVTTYYAVKLDVGERDLKVSEINTYNKYNTRGPSMQGKLPIGPISNVSESSIKATLNPTNTDALFFVADKNGEIYFTKTNEEHNQMINKLKSQGLWYEYN